MKKLFVMFFIFTLVFFTGCANKNNSDSTDDIISTSAAKESSNEVPESEETSDIGYSIWIQINQDQEYMIENGYAKLEDGYLFTVDRSVVMKELLDLGEIPSDEYYKGEVSSADYAMSWIVLNFSFDKYLAEQVFEIIKSKGVVGSATLNKGYFYG